MDNIPVGISSNTPLHVTCSSGSREIGWGVVHLDIVSSDLDIMGKWLMLNEVVCKILSNWVPTNSEMLL